MCLDLGFFFFFFIIMDGYYRLLQLSAGARSVPAVPSSSHQMGKGKAKFLLPGTSSVSAKLMLHNRENINKIKEINKKEKIVEFFLYDGHQAKNKKILSAPFLIPAETKISALLSASVE